MIEKLELFFENADKGVSKIDNYLKEMNGMSGTKTRHFYNNLLSVEGVRYLEVGTYLGSSVCSAMCGNSSKVLCIDNWSEFAPPGAGIKESFLQNFDRYKGSNDASFLEQDCFSIEASSIGKFNIFMYDGNHSYESHYRALPHFIEAMDDEFVFIVDDWDWGVIREATLNSIKDLNLEIKWNREIRGEEYTSCTQDREGWWNGISVFLLKKQS